MKKNIILLSIIMLLIGGYMFLDSMLMISTGFILENWMVWTLYLTIGIILISFAPGLIVWGYSKDYQDSYSRLINQTTWQVIQIPSVCSFCQHEIAIHSLEWIGPDEARCPFCSNEIEVRTSQY
ncbi:hypothetical protein EU527_08455 [Candidatus Thorarchaeota archaeon]|nr:MAG: hypothetical protein EU527_08455 [Candidatus Thorarchaeota archaeon]